LNDARFLDLGLTILPGVLWPDPWQMPMDHMG
jgi:hypothetical protein